MNIDSEKSCLDTWEAVDHQELPNFSSDEKNSADIAALIGILSPKDKILDLGCGWGRITLLLVAAGYDIVGIDLSPNLIRFGQEEAKKSRLHVKLNVGNMTALPYDNGSFSKIICMWGVYSHLLTWEDQLNAIHEMYRVLRPKGQAFIEMTNGESEKNLSMIQKDGFGTDKRLFVYEYGEFKNTLYLHDRSTLSKLGESSEFQSSEARIHTIGEKWRLVLYLHKDIEKRQNKAMHADADKPRR